MDWIQNIPIASVQIILPVSWEKTATSWWKMTWPNSMLPRGLKDLKMPVLIVAGRYDRVSVPKLAVQYQKYCPQAQFVIFEKSGHNPQVEEPDREFPIIRKFLRQ